MDTPSTIETTPPVQSPEVSDGKERWFEGGQCVILDDISWETYERLLAEHTGRSGTHFTYDRGRLQIMVLSAKHERPSHVLSLLVEVFTEEMELDVQGLRSTTFKRKDLSRGFEPDGCFYIQNADRIKGKDEIDLTIDPPPDLVIEVDITSPSLNKFPLFAALGIPEVWRYDGAQVQIFKLKEGQYVTIVESQALPGVTGEALGQFIVSNLQMKQPAWLRSVRVWMRNRQVEKK